MQRKDEQNLPKQANKDSKLIQEDHLPLWQQVYKQGEKLMMPLTAKTNVLLNRDLMRKILSYGASQFAVGSLNKNFLHTYVINIYAHLRMVYHANRKLF